LLHKLAYEETPHEGKKIPMIAEEISLLFENIVNFNDLENLSWDSFAGEVETDLLKKNEAIYTTFNEKINAGELRRATKNMRLKELYAPEVVTQSFAQQKDLKLLFKDFLGTPVPAEKGQKINSGRKGDFGEKEKKERDPLRNLTMSSATQSSKGGPVSIHQNIDNSNVYINLNMEMNFPQEKRKEVIIRQDTCEPPGGARRPRGKSAFHLGKGRSLGANKPEIWETCIRDTMEEISSPRPMMMGGTPKNDTEKK
jgi:hypothetical protein